MADRPNILFLMSDEHRADVAGFAGNRVVRTPVLDELAETGVVFQNAYAPSPVCVPSRQCMMSGQLPRTCNCLGWIDLAPGYQTFAGHLARYAYATVAFGKLHHLGTDQMMGWNSRPAGDLHATPATIPNRVEEEFDKHMRPFGDYKWSIAKEVKRSGVGNTPCILRDEIAMHAFGNWVMQNMLAPYYDRHQPNQPKLLKLSLLQPHYPYMTDEKRFCYYLNRVEPFQDEEEYWHPRLAIEGFRTRGKVDARESQRATAAYYGMVDRIDTEYGNALDILRNAGEDLDDWIIIYTSDHGDMLGEHGVWEKQSFHEGSARVPLIIRWPKRFPARVINENVNLCDLFATLCDLCGVETPSGLDSRSLVPLMEGKAKDWPNESVSAMRDTDLMIKRDQLKYCYYGETAPEVLFDLAADPHERHNAINDPEYAGAVVELRRRRAELGYGPDANTDYVNAGYGRTQTPAQSI